ncbi:hypothetical protein GQ600_2494 [Phytophthora cactorum]|nr:hypothetical protein GQ600_2494 [Phytophthora cactorum]
MGFRARWAELKKLGWTSKRLTGLSNAHAYVKPGKTKEDVCGQDYFIGKEERMRYLDRLDLGTFGQVRLCHCSEYLRYVLY